VPTVHRQSRPLIKTAVCLLAIVNLHVFSGGCGGFGLLPPGGWQRVSLSPEQPLKSTLKSGGFSEVSALDVDPGTGEFRFVMPAGGRSAFGTFTLNNGAVEVSTITFAYQGLEVSIQFDGQKRVASIENSLGQKWGPTDAPNVVPLGANLTGVDAYLAANPELIQLVRPPTGTGSDSGGSPGGGSGGGGLPGPVPSAKYINIAQAQGGDVSGLLGSLGLILGLQGAVGAWPVLYFMFQIVVAVNLTMGFLGGSPATPGPNTGPIAGGSTLRVINQLPGDVPIWFVVLEQDFETGAPGGNLLGEEGIPAGAQREFSVPNGQRNFNIISPSGRECFIIYRHDGVTLPSGGVTEILITNSTDGKLYPPDCSG